MRVTAPLYSYIVLLCMCLACVAKGQGYKLDIASGLPSNHVYMMLTDKQGYLWLATDKGVVRYNGYGLKSYALSNGQSDNGVWGLHKDRWERIWLYTFSNTIGYIRNGRYHAASVDNGDYILYPRDISEYSNGISFISAYRGSKAPTIFYELGDKVKAIEGIPPPGISANHSTYITRDDTSVQYYRIDKGIIRNAAKCDCSEHYTRFSASYPLILARGKHLFLLPRNGDSILHINAISCTERFLKLPDKETVQGVFIRNDSLFVITQGHIYKIGSGIKMLPEFDLASSENRKARYEGQTVTYMLNDPLWGTSVATSSGGIYFETPDRDNFTKRKAGSQYLNAFNGKRFWWDNITRSLQIFDSADNIIATHHPDITTNIYSVAPFDENILLLGNNLYMLDERGKYINKLIGAYNIRYALAVDSQTIYMAGAFGLGIAIIDKKAKLKFDIIQVDRFNDIVRDPATGLIYAYHNSKVLICDGAKIVAEIKSDMLKKAGIEKLERIIFTNKPGEVFIKAANRLLMLNMFRLNVTNIPCVYKLSGATMLLHENTLILAGEFGVAFIKPAYPFNHTAVYHNTKHSHYEILHALYGVGNDIFINTNRGVYSLKMPVANMKQQESQQYNIVGSVNDSSFSVHDGDTITVDQGHLSIGFDVVRPGGSGIAYCYFLIKDRGDTIVSATGDVLQLSKLKPGHYYTCMLQGEDRIWKSSPHFFKVYVQPLWWQAGIGKTAFWSLIVLVVGVIVLIVIKITIRIIEGRHAKMNQQLEVEIKSIHSQINPHFIFNTLNSALDFIKMKQVDAAYDHVLRFSQLLRSYLKSSRNRYVRLSDEITNLENYILLQQTRFGNKFAYEIKCVGIPEASGLSIPSLLLQPIVENAINHGLIYSNKPGKLSLLFKYDNDTRTIFCSIEDNGIGREQARLRKEMSTVVRESYGDQLVGELIELFNKYEQTRISMEYIDKQLPETGTIVNITFKTK